MAVEVSWYVEGRIVYVRAYDVVTVEDLREGNGIILKHLEDAGAVPIHILYDIGGIGRIAFSLAQILSNLVYLRHPSLGWLTIFGTKNAVGGIIDFFGSMVVRLLGVRVRMFDTLDQALAFLRKVDPTLSNAGTENGEKPL